MPLFFLGIHESFDDEIFCSVEMWMNVSSHPRHEKCLNAILLVSSKN